MEFVNALPGSILVVGDFNLHFNRLDICHTKKVLELLDSFGLQKSVNEPTHRKGNIGDWVVFRESDSLLKSATVDNNLSSDHFAVTCILNIMKPSNVKLYKDVRNVSDIDIEKFKADLVTSILALPLALKLST